MDQKMYDLIVHAHSIGRWIVLILLVFAILNSLIAGNRPYLRTDNRLGLILMIFTDIKLLAGIYLWATGEWGLKAIQARGFGAVMKNESLRFFAVEHISLMLIAVILIHLGKSQGRRQITDKAKHRRTMIFYFLALLIILVAVPWPFRDIGAGRGWY